MSSSIADAITMAELVYRTPICFRTIASGSEVDLKAVFSPSTASRLFRDDTVSDRDDTSFKYIWGHSSREENGAT